jgi:hypothetical protein
LSLLGDFASRFYLRPSESSPSPKRKALHSLRRFSLSWLNARVSWALAMANTRHRCTSRKWAHRRGPHDGNHLDCTCAFSQPSGFHVVLLLRSSQSSFSLPSHRLRRPTGDETGFVLAIHTPPHTDSGRVPHVHTSVRGLSKTGRSPIKGLSFPLSRNELFFSGLFLYRLLCKSRFVVWPG